MSDNLHLWDQFSDIDPKFTKPITGKDYNGTSPNAHYVVRCLTEMFGPIGQGFGWRVLAENVDQFGDTSIHWCRIEFWHTDRANAFEAYGQTKMAYKTKSGYLKVDEDAPKKSLTDAVTKAAAQIGVAANIFLGRWDDNQYVQKVASEYDAKRGSASDDEIEAAIANISAQQSMPDLVAYWKTLNQNAKHVAADQRVIDAKDYRKAEIEERSE